MSFAWQLGAGLALLFAGAELNVRGSRGLGLRWGMSPVVVGLTLVAYGTSAPELVVSLRAAAIGETGIAIANVIGSNICNVLLILGVASLIRPMEVHAQLLRVDAPLLAVVTFVVAGLLWLDWLGRFAGVLLVAGVIVYTISSVRRARAESAELAEEVGRAQPMHPHPALFDALAAGAGLMLLVAGGTLFVTGASDLATSLGVAPEIIGLTIVAAGTSLPELASSVVAALRGAGDVSIGNVVGSNLFNLLGILGLVAILHPLDTTGIAARDLAVMAVASAVLFIALHTRQRLDRWEGALFLVGFGVYMATLIP